MFGTENKVSGLLVHLFLQFLCLPHIDGDLAGGNNVLFGNNLYRLNRWSSAVLLGGWLGGCPGCRLGGDNGWRLGGVSGESSKALHRHLDLSRLGSLQHEPFLSKALGGQLESNFIPFFSPTWLWRMPIILIETLPRRSSLPTSSSKTWWQKAFFLLIILLTNPFGYLYNQLLPGIPIEIDICSEIPVWILAVSNLSRSWETDMLEWHCHRFWHDLLVSKIRLLVIIDWRLLSPFLTWSSGLRAGLGHKDQPSQTFPFAPTSLPFIAFISQL